MVENRSNWIKMHILQISANTKTDDSSNVGIMRYDRKDKFCFRKEAIKRLGQAED